MDIDYVLSELYRHRKEIDNLIAYISETRSESIEVVVDPVAVLDLSTKTYTSLKRSRIDTIPQLEKAISKGSLLKMRGIGHKTQLEVYEALEQYRSRKLQD